MTTLTSPTNPATPQPKDRTIAANRNRHYASANDPTMPTGQDDRNLFPVWDYDSLCWFLCDADEPMLQDGRAIVLADIRNNETECCEEIRVFPANPTNKSTSVSRSAAEDQPEIVPVFRGTRWMVSDPENADGGSIHIALLKGETAGTSDRRHAHVLVPPALCTDKMRDRREAYVTKLLQRCKIFHRWQIESIFPANS